MSRQIELRADLWWDWHRTQVILKVATSSVREEGSGFLSQILADVGMEGMLWGEVLMASQDRRMDQKTAVGHRV